MQFWVRVLALALAVFLFLVAVVAVVAGIGYAFGPLGVGALVGFVFCVVVAVEVINDRDLQASRDR